MPKRLDQSYIEKELEAKGWLLLSKYKNSKTKLKCVCPNGHVQYKIWNTFQQEKGCLVCAGTVAARIEHVRSYFASFGYELISTKYLNNKSYLKYRCPKGHKHSMGWKSFRSGRRCPTCSKSFNKGSNSNLWRGGVKELNVPLYSTYAHQLEKYQLVHLVKQEGLELLGVNCAYCDKSFVPTRTSVQHRVESLIGKVGGDNNIYCSDKCKQTCPTFKQVKYPKDFKHNARTRNDQTAWAKLVKERDNFTCQICGKKEDVMYAHHIDPVSQNPVESADIDNGITLCKNCHKRIHKLPGCSYSSLKCRTEN